MRWKGLACNSIDMASRRMEFLTRIRDTSHLILCEAMLCCLYLTWYKFFQGCLVKQLSQAFASLSMDFCPITVGHVPVHKTAFHTTCLTTAEIVDSAIDWITLYATGLVIRSVVKWQLVAS